MKSWAAGLTLTIGLRQFPTNFHPLIESSVAKWFVQGLIRRPITAYNADWELTCLMCRALPSVKAGTLKKTVENDDRISGRLTFQLPDAAVWGDGTPITTRDVLFTWKVGRHDKSGVSHASLFKKISRIDARDDKTFTLHLDSLTFDHTDLGAFSLLPAHLEEKTFDAAPDQYRKTSLFASKPETPGLHFGPYRIESIQQGAQIVLIRNERWWGKRPAFDRTVVRTISDTSALMANLLSGDVDMISGDAGLSLDQAHTLETEHRDRFHIGYKPGLRFEHVDLNLDNLILKDRRVRQGLMYATDRQEIVDRLFQGKYQIAHSSVSSLDAMFATDVIKYSHEPAKAASLLRDAGWTKGTDGFRVNGNGNRLRFEINTTAGHRVRESVLQVIQDQWRKSGIDLVIRTQPPRVLFGASSKFCSR